MVVINQDMHARVISGTVRDGEVAAGTDIVSTELVPSLSEVDGYQGCDLLVVGHRFMLMTWWMYCPGPGAIDELYAMLLAKFADVIDGVPDHVRYVRRLYHRMGEDVQLPPIG